MIMRRLTASAFLALGFLAASNGTGNTEDAPAPVTIYGMTVGERFTVPKCTAAEAQIGVSRSRTCWTADYGDDSNTKHIQTKERPEIGFMIDAYLEKGALAELDITTNGMEDQYHILDALRTKFGLSTSWRAEAVETSSGETVAAIHAQWDLSEIVVTFDPRYWLNPRWGHITIQTKKLIAAHAAAAEKHRRENPSEKF